MCFLILIDGLDAWSESYIPFAKDYPIALLLYLIVLAVPVVGLVFLVRGLRKKKA
jgi:hypothetical protein